jgi:Pentapeptide repeats (8 copies)
MRTSPETRLNNTSRQRVSVSLLKRLSHLLSQRPAWLLLPAVVLGGAGLFYSAWNPGDTGAVGVWAAIVGGIMLLYGCLFVFPRTFAGDYERTEQKRIEVENQIRTTLVQALLALVILIGGLSTWRQLSATSEGLRMSQKVQISQQFFTAVERLNAERLEVRLGAIYTLERLTTTPDSRQARLDNLTAYQLLAAFVRTHFPWPPRPLDNDAKRYGVGRYTPLEFDSLHRRAPDVELALSVLGTLDQRLPRGEKVSAFLSDTDLRGVRLGVLSLNNADLRGTRLDYADGRVAKGWPHAQLRDALLMGASLRCAHLEGVDFTSAHLEGADLRDADLRAVPNTPQIDAVLERAALVGARYNDRTQFPAGFNPASHRMRKDAMLLAMQGHSFLLVEGGQLVQANGREVVRGGFVVKRDGHRTPHPQHLDAAPAVTCNGSTPQREALMSSAFNDVEQ